MNIQALSKVYKVSIIKEPDIPAVYELCLGNPQYYEYCPPAVSKKSIRADMDLILKYPDKKTAFIGFFMMNSSLPALLHRLKIMKSL